MKKKKEKKKYHTVGIVERGKTGTLSTQIHDRSPFWFGTGTTI
jgi:hypothetical protein